MISLRHPGGRKFRGVKNNLKASGSQSRIVRVYATTDQSMHDLKRLAFENDQFLITEYINFRWIDRNLQPRF